MSEVTVLFAGPFFRAALLILLIGLVRRFFVTTLPALRVSPGSAGTAGRGTALRSALSARGLTGSTSVVSSLLVFLLVAEHFTLLGWTGFPPLHPRIADGLAFAALGGLVGYVLAGRLQPPGSSRERKWQVFLGLLAASLVTGLLARHTHYSPLAWRSILLLHMLFGEAALVLVPFLSLRRKEVRPCAPSCTM